MQTPASKKKENPLLSLAINIVLPSLILSKMSGDGSLGPEKALVFALSLPLGYGLWSFYQERKVNLIATLGLVNVLLTGVIGLFQLNKDWIAIKEASIPLLIALAILLTKGTRFSLVEKLLYNEQIIRKDRIEEQLQAQGTQALFQKRLGNATLLLSSSFLLSAVLNFALATWLIHSDPGTEAFNAELGKMNALSFPVIALPSMVFTGAALYYLVRSVKVCTGLDFSQVLVGAEQLEDNA